MQREKDTKDVKYQKSNHCLKMIDWLKIKKNCNGKLLFKCIFYWRRIPLWTENDFSKQLIPKKESKNQ